MDGRRDLWVQYVSSTPATRLDVVNLQESLDRKLQQRQARETGICPVREELYAQCFDEVIRQVTINCAERGLLLLRVRDEVRMTIAAYQTLYESSIAFGMRKALTAEHTKAELNNKVRTLEAEREDLEGQVEGAGGAGPSRTGKPKGEEDDAARGGGRQVRRRSAGDKAGTGASASRAQCRDRRRFSFLALFSPVDRWHFAAPPDPSALMRLSKQDGCWRRYFGGTQETGL